MGGGSYSHDAATVLRSARAHVDPATVFTSRSMHKSLDPRGVKFRESRDSTEHPESNAIAVWFDVTGSMGDIPRKFAMDSLPGLMKLLLLRDYIPHPQLLFGAIGDATSDTTPLQVGQFESALVMDEHLTNIYIEGNGGGQAKESYELGLYFSARHFSCDCWEKRGKKPYLFTIGDEEAYRKVDRQQVEALIGDKLEADITLEEMIQEINDKFEYFHIAVRSDSYSNGHHPWWKKILSERALMLDDPKGVTELIGMTIGACEGRDIDDVSADLTAAGLDPNAVAAAKKAIVPYAGTKALRKGTVAGDLATIDGAAGGRRI